LLLEIAKDYILSLNPISIQVRYSVGFENAVIEKY
jgi:hypothetical protein